MPAPGMYSTLARVLITVIITFLLVATFRMPYAAITLYSIFTVDRSSPSRLRCCGPVGEYSGGLSLSASPLAFIGVNLFAVWPPLTFAYYAFELFLVAFFIRTTRLPGPAMNMSMAIYSMHNAWERPYPAGPHIEQTLWVWLTLCLGFAVSVVVELAFVREDPVSQVEAALLVVCRRCRAFSERAAMAGWTMTPAVAKSCPMQAWERVRYGRGSMLCATPVLPASCCGSLLSRDLYRISSPPG